MFISETLYLKKMKKCDHLIFTAFE